MWPWKECGGDSYLRLSTTCCSAVGPRDFPSSFRAVLNSPPLLAARLGSPPFQHSFQDQNLTPPPPGVCRCLKNKVEDLSQRERTPGQMSISHDQTHLHILSALQERILPYRLPFNYFVAVYQKPKRWFFACSFEYRERIYFGQE